MKFMLFTYRDPSVQLDPEDEERPSRPRSLPGATRWTLAASA